VSIRATITRRVRKLLGLARKHPDEPEGRSAQAMADRLIDKYQLTESETSEVRIVKEPLNHDLDDPDMEPGGEDYWQCVLLAVVARFYGCEALHNADTGISIVIGDRRGVDRVLSAFEWLPGELTSSCDTWWEAYKIRRHNRRYGGGSSTMSSFTAFFTSQLGAEPNNLKRSDYLMTTVITLQERLAQYQATKEAERCGAAQLTAEEQEVGEKATGKGAVRHNGDRLLPARAPQPLRRAPAYLDRVRASVEDQLRERGIEESEPMTFQLVPEAARAVRQMDLAAVSQDNNASE